jgi:hypothetical protein
MRRVDVRGTLAFPYLEPFGVMRAPVASTLDLDGWCNGVDPCSITPIFAGSPFEGEPERLELDPTGTGYTLDLSFAHVQPGPPCPAITITLRLAISVEEGTNGWGFVGYGQFVPQRRSSPLADGTPGCRTDVATFSFASAGLTPPPQPDPAPAPPG